MDAIRHAVKGSRDGSHGAEVPMAEMVKNRSFGNGEITPARALVNAIPAVPTFVPRHSALPPFTGSEDPSPPSQ